MHGITVERELIGTGAVAEENDLVDVVYSLALNQGDVVQTDQHASFALNDRNVIAGLRFGIRGMRVGGSRRIRISPHLGYRDKGVTGTTPPIPPNAVLVCDLQLIAVRGGNRDQSQSA